MNPFTNFMWLQSLKKEKNWESIWLNYTSIGDYKTNECKMRCKIQNEAIIKNNYVKNIMFWKDIHHERNLYSMQRRGLLY